LKGSYIKVKTFEVTFVNCTTRYNLLDNRRIDDILEKLKVDTVEKKLT
jgi:hypothetical protein